jgi:RNA polymerase sigma-70 factor (ECF subfamily)
LDKKTEDFLNMIDSQKRLIYKVTNAYCRASEGREDLVQEIILQLWQSYDKYNSNYKLTTWTYRIALNTAISYYRKSKKRLDSTTDLLPIIETNLISAEPYQENKEVKMLYSFIQELKEIDKALILLYLDELSHKEIAEVMGISTTNVATKISRIKKNLQLKFQSHFKNK